MITRVRFHIRDTDTVVQNVEDEEIYAVLCEVVSHFLGSQAPRYMYRTSSDLGWLSPDGVTTAFAAGDRWGFADSTGQLVHHVESAYLGAAAASNIYDGSVRPQIDIVPEPRVLYLQANDATQGTPQVVSLQMAGGLATITAPASPTSHVQRITARLWPIPNVLTHLILKVREIDLPAFAAGTQKTNLNEAETRMLEKVAGVLMAPAMGLDERYITNLSADLPVA